MGEEWRAGDEALDAIAAARKSDPFAVLGPHQTAAGMGHPGVRARGDRGPRADPRGQAARRSAAPQGRLLRGADPVGQGAARLSARSRDRARNLDSYLDPYAFGPVLGPLDDYLVGEGTHRQLYDRLGAQLIDHEGVDGVHFAVWAPNARACRWSATSTPGTAAATQMRKRVDSGLWEIFVPDLAEGASTNTRSSARTARCCR